MVAIITGDIIASRKLERPEKWLKPLKLLFNSWGDSPKNWKLERGDFFQLEISNPEEVLKKVLEIKAVIQKVEPKEKQKKIGTIDVRMAIGIGDKIYAGESISESNGTAFIYSGEKFDVLKKENITLGIKTNWQDFDDEMNLYLKLIAIFMDKWTVSSAELAEIILTNPSIKQEEIGVLLNIKQSAVSRRLNRANVNEIIQVEKMFRKKLKSLIK